MKRTPKKIGTAASDRLKAIASRYGKIGGRMRMEAMTDRERTELASRGGRVGGKARAASLTDQQRSDIAKAAARARWAKR